MKTIKVVTPKSKQIVKVVMNVSPVQEKKSKTIIKFIKIDGKEIF